MYIYIYTYVYRHRYTYILHKCRFLPGKSRSQAVVREQTADPADRLRRRSRVLHSRGNRGTHGVRTWRHSGKIVAARYPLQQTRGWGTKGKELEAAKRRRTAQTPRRAILYRKPCAAGRVLLRPVWHLKPSTGPLNPKPRLPAGVQREALNPRRNPKP